MKTRTKINNSRFWSVQTDFWRFPNLCLCLKLQEVIEVSYLWHWTIWNRELTNTWGLKLLYQVWRWRMSVKKSGRFSTTRFLPLPTLNPAVNWDPIPFLKVVGSQGFGLVIFCRPGSTRLQRCRYGHHGWIDCWIHESKMRLGQSEVASPQHWMEPIGEVRCIWMKVFQGSLTGRKLQGRPGKR